MTHGTLRVLVMLAGGVAAGCASPTIDGVLGRHKATVRRVFDEALNQGRYDVFAEAYDSSFIKHVNGRSYTLREEVAQAKATHEQASDLVMTVDTLITEGDLIVVQWTGRGTNDRPYRGLAPTGKRFVMPGVTVYRFAGNRIVEEWTYYNELDVLRQLGLMPGGQ